MGVIFSHPTFKRHSIFLFNFIFIISMCICVCVYVSAWSKCADSYVQWMHVDFRRKLPSAHSIIPQWVLRIKLRLLGLCSKSLYLLSCPSPKHPTLMFSQFGSLVSEKTSLTQAAHVFSHSPFPSSYAWARALCFCHDLHIMHWNIYWAWNFMFSCNTDNLLWKTFLDHLLFFQILVNKTKGQSFSVSFFNI